MRNFTRLVACAVIAAAGAASADSYPTRAVKVIVPWPPGQNTDVAARMVSEKLGIALGQPFIIENKPGAGGLIGTEAAVHAPADGHTLLAASSGPISISPNVQKVSFDPARDLAPVSLILTNPFVMVVDPSLPVTNLREFVALLRANPGKYSFASSGAGATSHLMTALFNSMARVEAVHVPYKGSAQSVMDVVNGQVAYTIESIAAVAGLVRSGRLRALGITTVSRSHAMPDVPPIAEAGDLPDYDVPAWVGIMAPAGTPAGLRQRLALEIRKVIQAPGMTDRMVALGMEPASSTPEEFAEFLKAQQLRYASIAREAKLKAD
jgi:tripartite-type tricarboxylate transporter receptor subunit TctC